MSRLPAAAAQAGTAPQRGALERLPKWLICVPLVAQWLWLALRHGSATLPSAANPAITCGGLVGESKSEYFATMGPLALAATARHCAVSPAMRASMTEVGTAMARADVAFPLIAKPDLGMCGFGVRRVESESELAAYFAAFPERQVVLLQAYLPHDGEAGIFYAREPDRPQGRIIGLALRYFPRVVGDGVSSIGGLMDRDHRARRLVDRPDHEFTVDRARVPALGEVVRLATVGSTRIGGLYRDGGRHVTPALTQAIDAIARDMRDFHFGRFDVRFASLAQLAAGEDFTIMEVNGAGSEAIQAWDPDIGLVPALRIIFDKQRTLFQIGAANRRRGHPPVGLRELARMHFMQQRLLGAYPPSN